jgi:hypothetical protein
VERLRRGKDGAPRLYTFSENALRPSRGSCMNRLWRGSEEVPKTGFLLGEGL